MTRDSPAANWANLPTESGSAVSARTAANRAGPYARAHSLTALIGSRCSGAPARNAVTAARAASSGAVDSSQAHRSGISGPAGLESRYP